jgi:hypothetical protein
MREAFTRRTIMKQQFAGATGYITSNFTLSDAADVTDHQFGVIFVK